MSILSVRHLTVCIGQMQICENLSFEIRRGESWALLGPNGSGKSTLLQTLSGLHPAACGEIFIEHQPLESMPRKKIAQTMAVLFQSDESYFGGTVLEYCLAARFPHLSYFETPSKKEKQIIEEALHCMHLFPLKDRLAHTLSGGEKRRLSLAAALSQTPKLYLLDEPMNHLDLPHQISTLSHFQTLCKRDQKAMILSLHDINIAARFSDHLIMLFPEGALVGTTEELLNASHLSRLYQHPIHAMRDQDHLFWQPEWLGIQSL